ncbi:hypothetical protein QAD02_021658 [Eretmocerus hayati]|uniref:Uncharacterized protein n=1 Tax=Eretmocerus hayati TaxID=131215 RepID=A0ACC2PR33_9HYME|nr:hypothetical protein QAD02_021658 [Eretmocerus hayati]
MSHECSRDENRIRVCAPYGKKIVSGDKSSNHSLISDKHGELIEEFVKEDFNLMNPKTTLSICASCRVALQERCKNILKRLLQVMPNYDEIVLPKKTKSSDDTCDCHFICTKGRLKGHGKNDSKTKPLSPIDDSVFDSNSTHSNVARLFNEKQKKGKVGSGINECEFCHQEFGRGLNHNCNPRAARADLMRMVDTLPETQRGKIASEIMKSKVSLLDCSSGESTHQRPTNCSISLKTFSPDSRVHIDPKDEAKSFLTAKS